MEMYDHTNKYQILKISRSKESLIINENDMNESDVSLSLLPYLVLDVQNREAKTILTSKFIKKDNTPLTNELIVRVCYKFADELPIISNGSDKVNIRNYKDLLSIFDTSIGVFRGVLFEWLDGSIFQHPLPFIHIDEFVKELRISFSK